MSVGAGVRLQRAKWAHGERACCSGCKLLHYLSWTQREAMCCSKWGKTWLSGMLVQQGFSISWTR